MSDRIIRDIEPSLPYTWIAILTKETQVSKSVDMTGSAAALSALTTLTSTLQQIASGDLSGFLFAGTGQFGADIAFSALANVVQLPSFGFSMQYEDFGFCRFPTVAQITTDPVAIEFLDNSDAIVSRYFLDWINEIAPIIVKLQSSSSDVPQNLDVGLSSLFMPLNQVSRTLFLIKTKRSVSTATVNYLLDFLNRSPTGQLAQLSTGFYELPVQIYCFPKVVPQKVTEGKLDKSDGTTLRTIQTILERVPTLLYPDSPDSTAATQIQLMLSATMGWAKLVDSLSSSLLGVATAAVNSIAAVQNISKVYSKADAAQLIDLSQQPEQNSGK